MSGPWPDKLLYLERYAQRLVFFWSTILWCLVKFYTHKNAFSQDERVHEYPNFDPYPASPQAADRTLGRTLWRKDLQKKRLFGGPNAEMPKNFRSVNRPKAWSGCLNTELEFPWKIKGFDFIPRRVISLHQSILLLFYEVRHPCYPNWFITSFTIPVGRDRDQKTIT